MKYRGLIFHDKKDLSIEELEIPECGDNDVILKNVVASVCGSDPDCYLNGGELHYLPKDCELGHEVACEVFQVGKNVKDVKVGDRVAPFPLMTTPNPRKAGYLGGFSEYIYCTNASYEHNLFKLPDDMSYEIAALIEPLSVGMRGGDIVPVNESSVIVILGAGFIGYGLAAGLVYRGVKKENITFVDRCPNRIQLCKDSGYNGVVSTDPDWKEQVIAAAGPARSVYGPGCNADVMFDCAGSIDPDSTEPTLMEEGIKLLKYFGKFVCVGIHRRQPKLNIQKLVMGMYDIYCGSGNTKEYFEMAIKVLQSGVVDFNKAITKAYRFEDAEQAIIDACDTMHCMKMQVDYRL